MYNKYLTLLVLLIFTCACQTSIAKDAKNKPQKTFETRDTVETRSAAYKSSLYKPSDLLLDLDFEKEEVKQIKAKRGTYDKLVLKTAKGGTAALGIMYEGGQDRDRHARITADPKNKENHVLHYWLKNARVPDQKKGKFKGRIQLNLADFEKTSVFQRYRLYLHPDLDFYRQYPNNHTWFVINEFWMGAKWKDHPYPFRLGVNIAKPEGVGKPLYFVVEAGVAAGGEKRKGKWKGTWSEVGRNFEIPLGEWLDVEVGYKQGDIKTGRFYMAVKREKDKQFTTVFDVTNWTYHPDSPKPVPLTDWQPLKVYTNSSIVDFVRQKGGITQMYWDDLEIYANW